ncbi:hypothetical protein SDC9_77071 [bioreactor metagenome]|uniref:Uncharacterized protein n=1 Tax=bioreactor metagenome TaxID=1076179 RepID=A0A644YRL9_9ZZZZ
MLVYVKKELSAKYAQTRSLSKDNSDSDHSSGEAPARRRTSVTIGTFSGEGILTGEQQKMQAELRRSLRSPELRAEKPFANILSGL